MKTLFKILGVVILLFIVLAATGVSWLVMRKPSQRPASAQKVEATPERLARGKYLAEHVSGCFDCHSERTPAYGLPIKPGREGVGGFVWTKEIGFPGTLAAPNITPDPETGLGKWTDGEIIRAIREGVDRNGNALFPIMPYGEYRDMSEEDVASIVAYLRTVKPQRYERPKKALDPPMNVIEKFIPKPLDGPVAAPAPTNTVAYGHYLSKIAGCHECHTPKDDKGQPLAGKDLAGGFEMKTPQFRVITSNITPHPTTWLGRATKEQFIGRFQAFAGVNASNAPEAQKGRNTLMPWLAYSHMTAEDLGALYDYLKTVPPVENTVDPFPDA